MTTRLPRYTRTDACLPVTINKPKHALLAAVGRFGYLSAPQLTRLCYGAGSLTWVQQQVSELFHGNYLDRVFLQPSVPRGTSLAVYVLDNPGYKYLQAAGLAPEGRFRASEQVEREQLFLRHTLAANDVLISAHLLAKSQPQVELAQFRTERELKLSPTYVTLHGQRIGVVPDGWIELHIDAPDSDELEQRCIAFELDRNTERRLAFRKKIAALVSWEGDPYKAAFGTDSLTVAVVAATGGPRHLQALLTWTEAELTQLGAKHQADLFRFAAFDPASADPTTVFLAPLWVRPFDPRPVPLIACDD